MKDMNHEIGNKYARVGKYEDAKHYLLKSFEEGNFDSANEFTYYDDEDDIEEI